MTYRKGSKAVGIGAAALIAAGIAAGAPAANAQGLGNNTGSLASVGTASQIPEQTQPSENRLLLEGTYGLCYMWSSVDLTPGGYPSSATMSPSANSIGLGDCTQEITLHWKNLDKGTSGEQTWTAKGPGNVAGVGHPYDAIVGTGGGTVEFTATADKSGASSETLTLEVPEYEG